MVDVSWKKSFEYCPKIAGTLQSFKWGEVVQSHMRAHTCPNSMKQAIDLAHKFEFQGAWRDGILYIPYANAVNILEYPLCMLRVHIHVLSFTKYTQSITLHILPSTIPCVFFPYACLKKQDSNCVCNNICPWFSTHTVYWVWKLWHGWLYCNFIHVVTVMHTCNQFKKNPCHQVLMTVFLFYCRECQKHGHIYYKIPILPRQNNRRTHRFDFNL